MDYKWTLVNVEKSQIKVGNTVKSAFLGFLRKGWEEKCITMYGLKKMKKSD